MQKKIYLGTLIALAFMLVASSANAQSTTTNNTSRENERVTIQIMKHICKASIKNESDFRALEEGLDPVAALANTVLNCPTTSLPGDPATPNSVAAPRTDFNFTVKGEHNNTMNLKNDGDYMQNELCESAINKDVDGNGTISETTCLDTSHYGFEHIYADNYKVNVREINSPEGTSFGVLRFTPSVVDGNNDIQSLLTVDDVQGLIKLDLTNDTDKSVMLHVYNFMNEDDVQDDNPNNGDEDNDDLVNQIRSLIERIQKLQDELRMLVQELS